MTERETLKLALDALETERENYQDWDKEDGAPEYIHEAITAIKEALAQPEQEPVAWMTISPFGDEDDIWYANPEGQLREGWTYKALYEEPPKQNPLTSIDYVPCCTDQTCSKCKAATPPQRKPLTDKELNLIGAQWHYNLLGKDDKAELFAFARAIEAAHGIKGEA